MPIKISIDAQLLQDFCEQRNVKRLALFGSVLREDFNSTSDVDVLVEFEEGQTPSLLWWPEMIEVLSNIFGGRRIDLVTPRNLNPRIKSNILAEAVDLYVHRQ